MEGFVAGLLSGRLPNFKLKLGFSGVKKPQGGQKTHARLHCTQQEMEGLNPSGSTISCFVDDSRTERDLRGCEALETGPFAEGTYLPRIQVSLR